MRVLVVEDEPAALRALTSVIERRCEGFEVAGTAENGAEGLEKVRLLRPDIVITDVKMPVMDGIRFLTRMKAVFPSIPSIIVSGYQDFEYARSALQIGVLDYLLKPVSARKLKAKLETVRRKLEGDYHAIRIGLLEQLVNGASIEAEQRERYLPFKSYLAAILRRNGLPSRFHQELPASNPGTLQQEPASVMSPDCVWILAGQDDAERLIVGAADLVASAEFESSVDRLGREVTEGFFTIAQGSGPCGLSDLPAKVRSLHKTLDHKTVIGLTQTLPELPEGSLEDQPAFPGESLYRRFDFLIASALDDHVKEELARLHAEWERERRPQIWVETALRDILHHCARHAPPRGEEQAPDLEFLLDDAVFRSRSFGDLADRVWGILQGILRLGHRDDRVDTPAFFDSIATHLAQNLAAGPTLQAVCARFGVSQTYLSRLCRKYKGMSFNEYLTVLRIDRAKTLIRENPAIRLRDVAEMVGYNDQFYLSRVFKSVAGVSPSEFARTILGGEEP